MSISVDSLVEGLNKMSLTGSNGTASAVSTIHAAKAIAGTLRPFSGRSEHLESFINSVDKFYDRYGKTTDNSLSEFVFATICSKIIDEAGDFLLCRHDLDTWPEIKTALRNKFGDKLDRNVLQQQFIFLTRNRNENIIDFLDRLKVLKMRLNLKINADPYLDETTKLSLINQNEITAVTVLLTNTNPELRTLLMIKNPKDIEEATAYVINHSLIEQQLQLRQPQQLTRPHRPPQRHIPQISKLPQFNYNPRQFPQSFVPSQPQPFNQRPFANMAFQNQQPFPRQPINVTPRPVQRHFPTNEQVFGKPVNVFSPKNSHKPQGKPEPMSTSSKLPTLRTKLQNYRPNFFKSTGPCNFIAEELTNLETNYPSYPQEPEINEYYLNYENVDYSNSNYGINHKDIFENNYNQDENYFASESLTNYQQINEQQTNDQQTNDEQLNNQNFHETNIQNDIS